MNTKNKNTIIVNKKTIPVWAHNFTTGCIPPIQYLLYSYCALTLRSA